jgi:hypothetical protein
MYLTILLPYFKSCRDPAVRECEYPDKSKLLGCFPTANIIIRYFPEGSLFARGITTRRTNFNFDTSSGLILPDKSHLIGRHVSICPSQP